MHRGEADATERVDEVCRHPLGLATLAPAFRHEQHNLRRRARQQQRLAVGADRDHRERRHGRADPGPEAGEMEQADDGVIDEAAVEGRHRIVRRAPTQLLLQLALRRLDHRADAGDDDRGVAPRRGLACHGAERVAQAADRPNRHRRVLDVLARPGARPPAAEPVRFRPTRQRPQPLADRCNALGGGPERRRRGGSRRRRASFEGDPRER